nr:hypothetical protein [Tanacetum cinerariifolium]
MTIFNGNCDNCIYGNGKPIICTACGSMVKGGLCLTCDFREKNLYNCDPNAYSFDNTNYFPQSQYENHLCSLCGNNSHDGYDCQQFPLVHEQELSYNQNYDANHSIQNEESSENPSNEIAVLNSNQEKKEPSQEFDIHQLIEECSIEVPEKQKQSMEDTILEDTSQISLIHSIAPIQSTKEPEHSLSMGYEHLSITPETESDEVTESNAENLLPILSECEVTLEDKRECDLPISENSPICDNHSDIFIDSKIDDDISVYDDFEDIEYVEASLSDPEIVSIEEENVVYQEEEEIDLEGISQIQDIVLREKLLSITRLISNIESLNENSTPDRVFNSFESDNSLLDNFSPEFKTFCDHTEETRSGNIIVSLEKSNKNVIGLRMLISYQSIFELEAHYMYMAQLQEVSPDVTHSGPIFDDEPVQKISNNDHYNVFAMKSIHP